MVTSGNRRCRGRMMLRKRRELMGKALAQRSTYNLNYDRRNQSEYQAKWGYATIDKGESYRNRQLIIHNCNYHHIVGVFSE